MILRIYDEFEVPTIWSDFLPGSIYVGNIKWVKEP